MNNENGHILLVDGMALLFRGFYATAYRKQYMRRKDATPTNGVRQFLRYLMDAVNRFDPSHVICCWDVGSKTFRNDIYSDYKGNRGEPPEELIPQFSLVQDVTDTLNIPNIGLKNFEADDCIGTLASRFQSNHKITILTGDRDMLQLASQYIHIALMLKGIGNYKIYNEEVYFTEYNLMPKQMIDLKGLMGDSSDNYPGVRGIGEKTALKLLQKYKSIDVLLENLSDLSPKQRDKVVEDENILHISRKLAEIKCDLPIKCKLENARWEYDRTKVNKTFSELGLTSMTRLI